MNCHVIWCRCPNHNCSDNGQCSSIDGTCQCSSNWTGIACNESLYWNDPSISPTPTKITEDTISATSGNVGTPEILPGILAVSETTTQNTAFESERSLFEMPEVSETRLFSTSMTLSTPSIASSCHPQVQQTLHNCKNCGLVILILCMVTTASVIVHIFICVRLKDSNQQEQNLPKRRKLRKRSRSQFRLSDSSSDCSI